MTTGRKKLIFISSPTNRMAETPAVGYRSGDRYA